MTNERSDLDYELSKSIAANDSSAKSQWQKSDLVRAAVVAFLLEARVAQVINMGVYPLPPASDAHWTPRRTLVPSYDFLLHLKVLGGCLLSPPAIFTLTSWSMANEYEIDATELLETYGAHLSFIATLFMLTSYDWYIRLSHEIYCHRYVPNLKHVK